MDPYLIWHIRCQAFCFMSQLFHCLVSGRHGAFLQNSNLTLIIGACHSHLCSEQHQIPGEPASWLNGWAPWCRCTEFKGSFCDVTHDPTLGATGSTGNWLIAFPWKARKKNSFFFFFFFFISYGNHSHFLQPKIRCTRSFLSQFNLL